MHLIQVKVNSFDLAMLYNWFFHIRLFLFFFFVMIVVTICLEFNLAMLESCDILENSFHKSFSFLKSVIFLYLFEFMVKLDALIFFEDNSQRFFIFPVKNSVNALQLRWTSQLKLIWGFLPSINFIWLSLISWVSSSLIHSEFFS